MTARRPYALPKNRGKYPPSVTTVLGALGGSDGLKFWTAGIVAAYAVDHTDKWQHLSRDAAYDKLYRLHMAETAAAAERGTIVHAVNEAWTAGHEVDLAEMVYDATSRAKQPITQWQGREDFIVRELDAYVDALERFWLDFQPRTVGSEEVVVHDAGSHSFCGQRDWVVELAGVDGTTLVDLKTIDKVATPQDPFKGIYLDKYRLQLAAYRGAKQIAVFDDDGVEVSRHDSYPIAQCCVLALRSDGSYQLVEVRAGGDEFAHFLRLVDMHHWIAKGCKQPPPVDRTIYKAMAEGDAA